MAKLTDEDYRELWRGIKAAINLLDSDTALQYGRAAYEAVRTMVLAEALTRMTPEEYARIVNNGHVHEYEAINDLLSNRLARLTAPPVDPAVEAVLKELMVMGDPDEQYRSCAEKIVAAVRSADKVRS